MNKVPKVSISYIQRCLDYLPFKCKVHCQAAFLGFKFLFVNRLSKVCCIFTTFRMQRMTNFSEVVQNKLYISKGWCKEISRRVLWFRLIKCKIAKYCSGFEFECHDMCSIQSIPKLRVCNLGCRLLLNQHHQHGSRRPRIFLPYSMNTLVAGGPTVVINHCALVDGFQLTSSRLSHSHLDAHSAA